MSQQSTVLNPTTTTTPTEPTPAPEKTFTQAQVDAMIGERLSRERAKYADYDALKDKAGKWDAEQAANMTDLQKAQEEARNLQAQLDQLKQAETVRGIRDKVAAETGVPADILTGDTEETCRAQAEKIKAYARPAYPQIVDNGTPTPPTAQKTTRELFADWANKVF